MFRAESRWHAFGIHLAISVIIFAVLLAFIIFIWYPGVFINMGGYQGIRIVAGVDLILGPVLTLMIYNPAKRAVLIKLDIAIISLVQISALALGTWIVYNERPVVQVLSYDGLHVHSYSEFEEYDGKLNELKKLSSVNPALVVLDLPESEVDIKQIEIATVFAEERLLTMRTDLYLPPNTENTQRWLTSRPHDNRDDCYLIEVSSFHFTGQACVNPIRGAIKLSD